MAVFRRCTLVNLGILCEEQVNMCEPNADLVHIFLKGFG